MGGPDMAPHFPPTLRAWSSRGASSASLPVLEDPARGLEDSAEHGAGQLARERILLARMIRSDQRDSVVEPRERAVAELRNGPQRRSTEGAPRVQVRLPADAPEPDDHADPREEAQLAQQIRLARRDLRGRRLVVGGRAPDRRGDVRVVQLEAVPGVRGRRLARERGVVERVEQPVAAAVAGEHPPGAVAAVGGRRQADEEESRAWVAESRERLRPVVLPDVAAGRRRRHRLAVRDESGTESAADDAGVQMVEWLLQSAWIVTR